MTRLKLILKTLPNGDIQLVFPQAFRLGFGFMALVVALSMAVNGTISMGGMFFTALCLAGSAYTEQWGFYPSKKTFIHVRGIWPLARPTVFPMADIENLTLHRHSMPTGARFQALSFDTKDEVRVIVDTRTDDKLEQWAWQISKTCQIALGFEGNGSDLPEEESPDPPGESKKQ